MKKITLNVCLIALFICFGSSMQVFGQEIGTIEYTSKKLSKLIKKDARIEVLAEGFKFTEGPLWLEKENMLLFSDVPANTIYKWTEAGGKEVYLEPAGYTGSKPRGGFMGPNGLWLTKDGKLWICQHGDRRIAGMDAPINAPKPNFVTIAGEYNGKRLNSPNDFFMSSKGDLYFTDPAYGFEGGFKDPMKEIPFHGVYKMDQSGAVTLLVDSIEAPNGIAIFPDGKTLLVANTQGKNRGWYAYDIAPDGLLKNGRVFYSPGNAEGKGGCDGLKIDKKGNVFATGPGGVWIFTKKGELIGKIKVNNLNAANCALTPDGKTLFITATQYLLRVKMR
jgi:gluconolactonase